VLRLRAGLFAAAAIVVVATAGCGGTAGVAPSPEPYQPRPALEVVDGDTGAPVQAHVSAIGRGKSVTRLLTTPGGRTVLPEGIRAVRARANGYSVGKAAVGVAGGRVEIYREELQSPEYGGGPQRTRYLPAVDLPLPRPRPTWRFDAPTLIEFPPAVRNGLVVFGINSGRVYALDANDGSVRWAKRQRGEIASTPAISAGRVYVSSMDGRLTSYRAADGKELWSFSTDGSPIESSPLVVDELVVVGAWNGTLYGVDARTGRPVWTYQAAGDIKSSVALADDLLVFGDYGGHVHGVDLETGRPRWIWSGGSRFYGGAAISDGLAVIGDVGGQVVALDAATGRQRWQRAVGSFVYASPAVARGTVFIGSYAGRFEALDLSTGNAKWSFDAGERISGSATVVGDAVYTAILSKRGAPRRTYALATKDGAVRWKNADGRYSPAVGAGHTLYIVGSSTLYAYAAT